MISKRAVRLAYLLVTLLGIAIVLGLILYALRQNIDLFYTPSELSKIKTQLPQQQIRIGGMVQKNSLEYLEALKVRFIVTDYKQDVLVEYVGILPDLFKEGQGVVAAGRLNMENVFIAEQILAKHDQNYMPR